VTSLIVHRRRVKLMIIMKICSSSPSKSLLMVNSSIVYLLTYLLILVQTMNVSISCMLCLVRETRTEIDRADRGSYNE